MRILCHLPERRLFRPLPQTAEWAYIWELRASSQVRLDSQVSNPWSNPVGLLIQPVLAQVCRFDLLVFPPTPDLPGCEIKLLEIPCYEGANFGVYSFQSHDPHPMLMVLLPATINLTSAESVQPIQKVKAPVKAPVKAKVMEPPLPSVKEASDGAALVNESRSNEERMEHSVKAVQEAVDHLSSTLEGWQSLGKRQKIELLKTEIKRSRGVGISTQTLYRDWIRAIWMSTNHICCDLFELPAKGREVQQCFIYIEPT